MTKKVGLNSNSIDNTPLSKFKDDINKKIRYYCLNCNNEEMNSLLGKYSILINIAKDFNELFNLQDEFNKERIKVLKKIEIEFRNENDIPIDFKYNVDYNESYKKFSESLRKMLNEYTSSRTNAYTNLDTRIDLIIVKYRSNAGFKELYSEILKIKEQVLNDFKNGNEKVEVLLNSFIGQIIELFAVYTSNYIKYHNLLLKSQVYKKDGKLKTKIDKLKNALKKDNFDECYIDTLEYIKQLEIRKKLTTIENIYQYILKTAMNRMSELSLLNDFELITKVNYQLIEINRILHAGLKGIIDIDELILLFNIKFAFSQEDINLINYLDDSVNTIKSSSIFLNPKPDESPFYYLDYFNEKTSLINCVMPMQKIDCNLDDIYKHETLDDLFDKGVLIGHHAYFFHNHKKDFGIVLLKYKDIYLIYSLDNNEYLWSTKVIYDVKEDNGENTLLKEVRNNNVDRLKQMIINYINDCKNNHIKEYFEYLKPLKNNT